MPFFARQKGLQLVFFNGCSSGLLEDKESSLAPTLQILLTKLWKQAQIQEEEERIFRKEDYQSLKKQGLLLKDFFEEQIAQLRIAKAFQAS